MPDILGCGRARPAETMDDRVTERRQVAAWGRDALGVGKGCGRASFGDAIDARCRMRMAKAGVERTANRLAKGNREAVLK